jgi:hypothetical protein
MAGMIKLHRVTVPMFCAGFAAACWGQAQPDALSGFQQSAERRTVEWTTLAANLEQRVTRLLPCDPRIRAAIEETGRASEARIVALNKYWLGASGKSRNQTAAIQRLLAREEASKDEWANERRHAGTERTAVAEQSGFLAASATRLPALADPEKALAASAQLLQQIENQIQARESGGSQLLTELRELFAASQARQNEMEAQLKFISTEGARWSAYYDARLKRAQMECVVTDPRAETAPPASPSPRGGKKK